MERVLTKTRVILLLCAGLLATGCSADYKVEIESNTAWSGAFGGKVVNGSGNLTIDLPDDGLQCILLQKNTIPGYIRMRVYDVNDSSTATNGAGDWVETNTPYGAVQTCVKL